MRQSPSSSSRGQTQDQLLALGRQCRTTETVTRATPEGIPLATDQLTVPRQDGLRADQEGGPVWSRQPAAERGQQQASARLPARAAGLALEDAKLMAEKEYLGLEVGLGAAADEEEIEEQAEQAVEQGQEHYLASSQARLLAQISCQSEFPYPTRVWAKRSSIWPRSSA
jgi:hypothetical protein